MASIEKIKEEIGQIAQRPKNTPASDIERIVNQLGQQGYDVRARKMRHGTLYAVQGRRFAVCVHNPGSGQLKICYVREFLDAMVELGLYE